MTDDIVEVVESDWVSVHTVALRVLPAVVTRDGPQGMSTPSQLVGEAYVIAETFVEVRARMLKAEYEAEERERGSGPVTLVEGELLDVPDDDGDPAEPLRSAVEAELAERDDDDIPF